MKYFSCFFPENSGRPGLKIARTILLGAVVSLGMIQIAAAHTKDCTVSKEFRLNRPQILSGVLQDPNGATLAGIELELMSGTKVIQHLRTTNDGTYDFGTVAAGKYRIHILREGAPFCAPTVRCGNRGCNLSPKLRLNPGNPPTIVR